MFRNILLVLIILIAFQIAKEAFHAHDRKLMKWLHKWSTHEQISQRFLTFAMEIHTIWTFRNKVDIWTLVAHCSIIVPVWAGSPDWKIHAKMKLVITHGLSIMTI